MYIGVLKDGFQHADFFALVYLFALKHADNQLDRQKKSVHAEKFVRKKLELPVTFFIRLLQFLINLRFSTNQIEKTDKQTKLTWLVVDHSHMAVLSV